MYLVNEYIIDKRRERVEIIISSNAGKPIYEQITSQIKAMPVHAGAGKVHPCQRHHGAESL